MIRNVHQPSVSRSTNRRERCGRTVIGQTATYWRWWSIWRHATGSAFPSSDMRGDDIVHPEDGPRIAVVGVTGAGKTRLSRFLSRKLGLPHIEMDALHWKPNWVPAPETEFLRGVASMTAASRWVADGNYSRMREIVWGRASDLVIVSPPHCIAFLRLIRRTLSRIISRRELWNGNRESLRLTLSRESIVVWFLKTHRRRYRTFIRQHRQPRYRHLRLHVVRTPRDERRLVSDLRSSST